jgi:Sugar kinases, ribokinase family
MTKKPKILVAGSFVMDLIASTDRAPNAGQTVVGRSFRTAPGGKGANQAVQCARLGADVTMIGCVGDDIFGREMLDTARAAGVNLNHVKVDHKVSSGIGHVLLEITEHSAQNRITVIPGANMSLTPEDLAWLEPRIGEFDLVMLQMEIPLEVNLQIAHWAQRAGVPVMLNPAPAAPLNDELLACVTYLTPNEQEAAAETGLPLRIDRNGIQRDDLKAVASALWTRGVKNVIITLGSNGSAVVGPDAIRYIPIVEMSHVADPTAAGDSFVAAFCVGLCIGLTQEAALTFASYTAAITVSRMGAMPSLPALDEVSALLRERGCASFDLAALEALR